MPQIPTGTTELIPVHIPTELIDEIIDELEDIYFSEPISLMEAHWLSHFPHYETDSCLKRLRDLLACRLVSRTFMDVCTPRVFKVVKVSQSQRRINAFWNLFGDGKNNLARHVRELVYLDGDDETAGKNTDPTFSATLSSLHLFPNLDTARMFFHCYGFSDGDGAREGAQDEQQNDLHVEDLLDKPMSSPYRRQLFILYSLAKAVNISIKHLYIHGLYLLPTTVKYFTSSMRFMTFFSGLQTLSIDVSSLGVDFVWNEFCLTFWKGIGRLLPGAGDLTSLVLSSDRLTSGPPAEAWDAMNLPSLTTLTLESFLFINRAAFGSVNTGLQAFLRRHLQSNSRLSQVVFNRHCMTYGSDFVWAMVYDGIANLVSLSSHSALQSFEHTPTLWILQGENYVHAQDTGNNISDYLARRASQVVLDLDAYLRLRAVLAKYKRM